MLLYKVFFLLFIESTCDLPPHQGEIPLLCDIATNRWWYNKETKKCETVLDRGCNRTPNNFESEQECVRICGK